MRKYVFIYYFTNSPGIILQINLLSIYMHCGNAFKEYISNPRPGLTPGTALRAVGSGIITVIIMRNNLHGLLGKFT